MIGKHLKVVGFGLALSALPSPSVSSQTISASSEAGKAGPPISAEVLARGQRIMEDLGWPKSFSTTMHDDQFRELTIENVFNGVYGRAGLTLKERELVIIALIIASSSGSLEPHIMHAAPRTGVSEENLREVIITACYYAGWPRCASAQHAFSEIFPRAKTNWPKELLRNEP